jgi:hypothetical protein
MGQDGLLFVAEDLEFIVGLEATTLLGEMNDLAYVDDTKGNVRVPRDDGTEHKDMNVTHG